MKSILFNTEMVRAISDGRKTVTRRAVKPQPHKVIQQGNAPCWCGHFVSESGKVLPDKPPYRPGDILYVRETWQNGFGGTYLYKADAGFDLFMTPDGELVYEIPWKPSIHMPREAARIFLRVTDVRVERLQDITELQILEEEGVEVDFPQPKPSYLSPAYAEVRLKPAVRKAFADLWDSTIKPKDRALYGWAANPWVWAIEFERISKEEAITNE